ncbi:hypothetical protein G1H11_13705 [Phytoactinopolyspora alkaliphila]|uniref:Serine hydroxymethyltransferase-like domain-containing protein n=1 Tax=Phytoactinopolyspora alkaliphila TaxID=1783498 RepID=A0A6N9YMS3_9ACTN|nr:hypothetical protein [Phytoactinopolyspora alkaliphila]NED96361.1 hypothetical protein [Phytoactinopolyspora alkaliphila]
MTPEVYATVRAELPRQQTSLEMSASDNLAPRAIIETQGSVLTNKYAEGYPGRTNYGGCEHVDGIEQFALGRAKELFGAEDITRAGISALYGGTAVHLTFVDRRESGLSGQQAEDRLHNIGITVTGGPPRCRLRGGSR